jgi:predicted ATPase
VRIKRLVVRNFRAITDLQLTELDDSVVIAGPNGCGKSCVFDAIRLLKSVYGGYQQNEWQNWFGEFQININQRAEWLPLLQNRSRPLEVIAEIEFADDESAYLKASAASLLKDQTWREVVPELASWRYVGATPLAANLRAHEPEVDRRVAEALPVLEAELGQTSHVGHLTLTPNGGARTSRSLALELVFSQYDPQRIGIIDYHGATRNYGRERVGGVNLNIEGNEDRLRQHALYNSSNKYANLKTEMASGYVRQLLSNQAGSGTKEDESLTDTLKELFTTFFPGKQFLGPQPTREGALLFPVRTPSGAEHDIDELSSGEKEVLYGYLRLRNAAPRNSVLLIDEPELHLNPRLIAGLASFYHRHLGRALNNQLWLVTHSDTLIREAVGQAGFSVFHMQPPGQYQGTNQVTSVQVDRDIDRLVIELVGDLAAYRPGAKIVVFEGGEDSQFDVRMTCNLFPEFQVSVNPVAGGNKRRVNDLYEILEGARQAGHLPGKFYAITDSDGDVSASGPGEPTRHSWDVYHIENYLLEADYILRVLQELNSNNPPLADRTGVVHALQECAERTIPALVAHKLRSLANRALVKSIDLGFDPGRHDAGTAIAEAVARSRDKLDRVVSNEVTPAFLITEERRLTSEAIDDIRTGRWQKTFRGRDVLRRFVGQHGTGIRYEAFRDLIVARMRDAGFRPAGMAAVVQSILSDPWR